MAEGFVLNIPKEMLDRLQKADEKIEKLDKNSRRVGENIRLAFMEGAKGVDKFIGSLNAAQKMLDGFKDRKINVGLNLDAKSVTDLKKQLENWGVKIPVGVTGTSGGNAGESQSLKNLLNGIVTLTTSVNNLTQKIDGIKVTGSGSTSGGGTSNGEKTDKGIGSYKSKINELLQIEKLIHDIDKAQTELAKKGDKSLSGKSLSVISNLRQQADKLLEELTKIEEKTNKDLSSIQTKWHAKELAEEQKQAKDNIAIQEKEANDLIKIEEGEIKEYERLMGKMLKLRKDINANTDLIYSPNPKVSQDALAQITKQEALLKQFEARVKTLEGKYGAGLSEIQLKYSQKELEMLNKAINNPASNSGIDQKTKDLREYEKVLKRISDLEKVRDRASKAISKYGANSQIGQQANALYQQAERLLQQHNQRKIALEQQYGTELDSIKQAQNAKDLNYLIQQKDAELRVTEQAEKKAIQQYAKLANERNRLLTEQYNNQKIIDNPKTDNATRQQAIKQQQLIADELQRNKQAMLNIEQQYQGKLATIQQRAGQQELQRVRRQSQQEIDEIRRAEQRRQDIQRRWDERRYSRPQGALQYSQNAKTINEQIKALNYLRTAQKSLDVSTSQGKKQFYELEREIKKTENALRRYGIQMGGVREQSSHLFNISQQLGRALSLMFSVSQIGQYISKMVNIRKEMELQQRSLQVLLQSKDKANELWNQTLDLAVKSPFRVKELVTYTKQLAAYRIESDKLFETNKMLADVSAGLGVDMQRLILAFGQVKSASFLRGCLGKGTLIRLYNDDIKEVQDIVVGDVIMGDDNTPRNVKEVIYGKEQMYIVKQGVCGDDYRVNENHILTLKDKITDTIVDVYVKDYLKDKERYNGVKIGLNGILTDYPIDVVKDNIDEYFGFVIDGNKRFQLGDGTITHNTELRQFTEAGIPMLEELSKYFEELYGRSVSVAEVFDMISKRMVTFTDVENVFQRMTSAGGVFFNMQEELSQTTAGMISNLQDSIDLMFNEIGKKNQGVINTAIKWARGLVDNWEAVGKVMKGALVTLLLYKAATMDINKSLAGIRAKWGSISAGFSLLRSDTSDFVSMFKGSIILTALTAIIALFIKWKREADRYTKAIEEVNKAHDKFRDSISNVELGFSNLFSQGVDDIEEYKGKLQELVGIAQQSYNIEMDFEIKNLESIDEVSRKFDELKEKILRFDNLSLEFDLDFTKQSDRGFEWFQDYLETDLKQLSSAQKDIKALASEIRGLMSDTIKDVAELDNLNKRGEELSLQYVSLIRAGEEEDAQKVQAEINSIINSIADLNSKLKEVDIDIVKSLFPRGVDESEHEYLQRVADGISQIYDVYKPNDKNTLYGTSNAAKILGIDMKDFISLESELTATNKGYIVKLDEATKELTKFYKKAHADIANLVNTSLRDTTLGFEPLDLIKAIKESTDENYNNLSEVITKELQTRGVEVNEELNQLLQQIVKAQDPNEVNEEFKRLVDILNKQSLDEEVSDYVYNSLKKIATDKELDETTFHEMLKQAEKYFSTNALKDNKGNIILETLDLDLIPEEKKPDPLELKEWQKAYNEEVDEILSTLESREDKAIFLPLKIRTDLQGVSTTQEKQLATINEAIDTSQKELDRLEKQKANLDAKLESGEITQLQYDALYTAQVDKQKKFIEQMTHLRDLLGGYDEKAKGGKSQLQLIKDQIALIRQLYDRYQELSNVMGSIKAKEEVINSFRDAVSALGLEDIDKIDFTNLGGIVTALEGLESKAQEIGKEAVQTLQKAIGESKVKLELMLYIQKQEEFENKIKEMFSDYEVSLELEKLDVPANWAETFFGVETKSLDDIKKALNERKREIDKANKTSSAELAKYNKGNLTEQEKQIKKALQIQVDGYKKESAFIAEEERKIAEMEAQQQEQRLKTYLEYARKAIGEKAKIKLEEYRKLQEIDEIFVAKEGATEEEKALFESTKKQAQAGVRREAREKQQKLEWEEFQKTDTFINIFNDLDSASSDLLQHTLSKLNEFKDVWTDMPLDDMEKVVDAINKIENALAKLKPVKAKKAAKDTIEDIMKDFTYTDEKGKERKFKGSRDEFEKVVEKELAKNEAEMAKTKDDIATLEATLQLLQENNLETVKLMYKRDDTKGIKDVIKLIEQGADNSEINKYIQNNKLTGFEDIFKEYQKQMKRESKGKDFKTEELNELLNKLGDEVSKEIKDLLTDIIDYKGEGADIGGLLQTSQIEFNFQSNIEDIDPRENIDKFVEYLTEIEKGNVDIAQDILKESLTNQEAFLNGFNKAITANEKDLSKVKLSKLDGWYELTQYDQKFFENVLAKMKGKGSEKKTLDEKDLVKIEEETIEYVNRVNNSLDSIKKYLSLVASGDTEGADEYYKANKDELKGYNKVLKPFVEAFEKATPNLQKVKKEIPKGLNDNTEYVLNDFLSYLEGITSVEEVEKYDTANIQDEEVQNLIDSLIEYLTTTDNSKKVDSGFTKYESLFTTLDEEVKKLSSSTGVELSDEDTAKIEEEIKTFLTDLSEKSTISEVNVTLGIQENQEGYTQDEQAQLETELAKVSAENADEQKSVTKEVEKQLKAQTKKLKQQEKQNKKLNEAKNANETIRKSDEEIIDRMIEISESVDLVAKGLNSVVEIMKVWGKDTGTLELFSGIAEEVANSVTSMLSFHKGIKAASVGAEGFGAAMNTAMGVIGWIVMAIQLIAKIISAIAEANDNRLLKQIEEQNRKIETLEKSYDKLSTAIDEAFTTKQLKEYNKELVQTTQSLIMAQKAAIAAQEQRKGANTEGSDEWKELQEMYEKLEEYEIQLEESQKNIYSKLTGGIMDDILSTTESFVDAWYDAFKETGDGLKGLEDNFNEMLLNLVKRQAAMKIAGRFVDEWNDALERYASDGDLSNSEIEYYANKVKNDLPALSSQLETFFSSFDNVLGDASGNLSGLQRGITQIQESTAQELASYLNSIRYIVSDSNAQLKALLAAQTSTSASNPIVAQLQVIAQQASAINTLLNSLTAKHPTQSGLGLKVII